MKQFHRSSRNPKKKSKRTIIPSHKFTGTHHHHPVIILWRNIIRMGLRRRAVWVRRCRDGGGEH